MLAPRVPPRSSRLLPLQTRELRLSGFSLHRRLELPPLSRRLPQSFLGRSSPSVRHTAATVRDRVSPQVRAANTGGGVTREGERICLRSPQANATILGLFVESCG